jgi:hypothetical protein
VTIARQGKADLIISLITEHALSSLLLHSTKTWQGGDYKTTIDLVLALKGLADIVTRYAIYATKHSSNYRTIKTVFNSSVLTPLQQQQEQLLLKNAPWKAIRDRISRALAASLPAGTTQQRTDRLIAAVLEAVHALIPRARLLLYAKR